MQSNDYILSNTFESIPEGAQQISIANPLRRCCQSPWQLFISQNSDIKNETIFHSHYPTSHCSCNPPVNIHRAMERVHARIVGLYIGIRFNDVLDRFHH